MPWQKTRRVMTAVILTDPTYSSQAGDGGLAALRRVSVVLPLRRPRSAQEWRSAARPRPTSCKASHCLSVFYNNAMGMWSLRTVCVLFLGGGNSSRGLIVDKPLYQWLIWRFFIYNILFYIFIIYIFYYNRGGHPTLVNEQICFFSNKRRGS